MVEGYTVDDLLLLSPELLASFLFDKTLVFSVGSATVLGAVRRTEEDTLSVRLTQIEGGGEGVLRAIDRAARGLATLFGRSRLEYLVDAVSCADPNLKLQRMLDSTGFDRVRDSFGNEVYRRISVLDDSAGRSASPPAA